MKNNQKKVETYKTIGQVAKKLNLIDKKTGKLQTYIIRYWESQFKQIKPSIRAGGRRYYSNKNIKMINFIKYLLKEKGMTTIGVKKLLADTEGAGIDDPVKFGVYTPINKSTKLIKDKIANISKIIKELKKIKDG